MNEIKCPKCGTTFQIDESYYDSIIKQIKTKEFNQELEKREQILLNEQKNRVQDQAALKKVPALHRKRRA